MQLPHSSAALVWVFTVASLHAAPAEDRWVEIDRTTIGPAQAPIVANLGRMELNGNGNRVVAIKVLMASGHEMEMLTEVDCKAKQSRTLASSVREKSGQLISGSGPKERWSPENQGPPLKAICTADLPTVVR